MPSRDYHEGLWEALPEGLRPWELDLRRRFLLERVRPGERVLDLGCGEGAFAAELLGAGASVLAADVAEEPLRRARARDPRLELVLLPSHGPWPLPAASFDVVWAGEVIEHVAETAAWLSEVRRVLRSGGRLLLSTPAHGRLRMLGLALSSRAFAECFDPRGDHLRFYSAATLRELLADFRFSEVRVWTAAGPPGARRVLLASALRERF